MYGTNIQSVQHSRNVGNELVHDQDSVHEQQYLYMRIVKKAHQSTMHVCTRT